ncbi:MAG: HigA family addiction module antidote protein [Myxococcales bacterium]|nr:HigA family addiction module antidote protein [Myxococcales bacterium]
MLPKNRTPTPPGEVLAEEFLAPLGMTQTELAQKMGVPVQRVNLLVNGKRAITAETALLLARIFEASPEFWMNLQAAYDLWQARERMERAKQRADRG